MWSSSFAARLFTPDYIYTVATKKQNIYCYRNNEGTKDVYRHVWGDKTGDHLAADKNSAFRRIGVVLELQHSQRPITTPLNRSEQPVSKNGNEVRRETKQKKVWTAFLAVPAAAPCVMAPHRAYQHAMRRPAAWLVVFCPRPQERLGKNPRRKLARVSGKQGGFGGCVRSAG